MTRMTIDDMLADARRELNRLRPEQTAAALAAGAVLIDIRTDAQLRRDGWVPQALLIERNVLEWRLDPASAHRLPQDLGLGDQVVIMCDEGYTSSLAAASLRQLGFGRATDVDGGYQAWRAAGYPVVTGDPASSRNY